MQKNNTNYFTRRKYFIHSCLAASLLLLNTPFNSAQAASVTSSKCPNQTGYYYTNDKSKRNPRKGGFVSESANVGDYVFIAPTAAVCDSASVLNFARVYGNAVVRGEAEVSDKARVYGNAIVDGEAVISGDAKVSGHARVTGSAEVKGKAWAKGYVVIRSGSKSKGKWTAAKPKSVIVAEKRTAARKQNQENKKNKRKMLADAKRELRRFQGDLDQGWYGTDKRKGVYRNFKYYKGDIVAPCGFYLKPQKEEKILDAHCRKTKKVRRKVWTPSGGYFKTVKNCQTDYVDEREKYFNFKKLRLSTFSDFSNDRDYLKFNNYYFYVGNSRSIKKLRKKLTSFANKYCR